MDKEPYSSDDLRQQPPPLLHKRFETALPPVRHYCRNPQSAESLKTPVADPRSAFCCKACERSFYGCRCRVCEGLFSPKTKRREVCISWEKNE
jgi:hypothetical protein